MTNAKEHFVQGMCRIADFWGMPKAMGAVYGCIYLSPEPLSLDDLVDQTGFSKGSISTNVRALERLQMVKQDLKVGDRKDYYLAEPDLWRVVKGVLEQRRRSEFASALKTVHESIDMLDAEGAMPEDKHRVAFQRQRIQHMKSFFGMLDKIVGGLLLINKLSASSLTNLSRSSK